MLYQGRSDLLTVTSAETVARPSAAARARRARSTARRARATRSARLFDDGDPHRGVYHLLANQLALLDAEPERGDARATRSPSGSSCCSPPASRRSSRRAPAAASAEHLVGFSGAAGGVVCPAVRGERVPARPGRARLPRRRARPPARRGARRAAARAGAGRAGDPRDARAPRAPAAAPGGRDADCADFVPNCARPGPAARRVRMDGVSAPVADRGLRGPHPRVGGRRAVAASPRAPIRPTRERPEEDCSLRTPFQRDRDRIVHCKAFRRLKHKTQVFVAPEGDHYRTRLTHTLETTQISRTVARALRLNEDLDGGDRARARPRPPAVRAHRRGRARPRRARALRPRLPPQRALAARRRRARAAQPDRAGARRDPAPLRAARASRRRSRARSCGSSTGSPTSTTTSTTRCAPA